jgi:DNA-binding MarR family transcriptional regulator
MVASRNSVGTSELVDALVELSFAVHAVLVRASAELDLTVAQLRLLGILRDRTPTMTAIANHLGIDRSSVTGLIGRAEHRGLVRRDPSELDARVTIVSATPTGLELGRQIGAMVTAELEQWFEGVSTAQQYGIVRVARSVLGPGIDVLH